MLKVIIIVSYIIQSILRLLLLRADNSMLAKPLPQNVKGIYDEKEYSEWQRFNVIHNKISLMRKCTSYIFVGVILMTNAYAIIFNMLSGFNEYMQYLIFTLILLGLDTIFETPFNYYSTFVVEESFGLNKSTKKTFFADVFKHYIGYAFILYVFVLILMESYTRFGNMAIVAATAAVIIIMIVAQVLAMPVMKMFNKFTPLEDGELKDKLTALCDLYNIKIESIVVRDASKRTTRANAFFTGFGPIKTISLDDNLVQNFSDDEIVAVFAHEFGHAKKRHSLKTIPFLLLNNVFTFGALFFALSIPQFYTQFGFDGPNYYWAITMISLMTWAIRWVLDAIRNKISRTHEYEADRFAAAAGYKDSFISALKKLHKEAMADINPHPIRIMLDYDHPTLSQRIKALEEYEPVN